MRTAARAASRTRTRAKKEGGYSPTVASKLVGVNYNTILYWVRTGLVKASIQYESKQWTPVLFSFNDLLELKFIQSLRDKGAPTRRIRKALNYLRRTLKSHDIASLYLDVTNDDIQVYATPDNVLSAVKNQGQLLLINVSRLRSEIEEKARQQKIKIA